MGIGLKWLQREIDEHAVKLRDEARLTAKLEAKEAKEDELLDKLDEYLQEPATAAAASKKKKKEKKIKP